MRYYKGMLRLDTVLMLCLLLVFAGCGGGSSSSDEGSPDDGTATINEGDVVRAVQTTRQAVEGGVTRLVRSRTIGVTVDCAESGEAVLNSDFEMSGVVFAREFTLDGTVTLNNCNGLNGTVDVDGAGTTTADSVDITATLSGAITDECTVTINNVTHDVVIDRDTLTASGTLSGSASGSCGLATITCSWDSVDIQDQQALEAGCR